MEGNVKSTGRLAAHGVAAAGLAVALACGGGSYNSPTGPSTGGGSPGPSGATITIGSNGAVSPGEVTISVGQSVTFVNNDSRRHDMTSDPHPDHTDCPPMNAVGILQPGQTRLTNAFPTARTCGFHDHEDPENNNLKGRVVVR
jgi:plastocyanin